MDTPLILTAVIAVCGGAVIGHTLANHTALAHPDEPTTPPNTSITPPNTDVWAPVKRLTAPVVIDERMRVSGRWYQLIVASVRDGRDGYDYMVTSRLYWSEKEHRDRYSCQSYLTCGVVWLNTTEDVKRNLLTHLDRHLNEFLTRPDMAGDKLTFTDKAYIHHAVVGWIEAI